MFLSRNLLLSLSVVVMLAACTQPPPPKHLGILLHGDSRIPLTNGFLEEMKTLGYEPGNNIIVTTLNTNNDLKQLGPLTKQLIDQKVDLLVAAGGLEAEEIKSQIVAMQSQTPMVVLYINAIIERQFVKDRRNPGWNVTGIDNLNGELSGKRMELLKDLVPGVKRVLVLYNPKIEPSVIGLAQAREQGAKHGIEIDARAVANSQEIAQTMAALAPGEVDAMLLVPAAPIDNELKTAIIPNAQRLKIPVMSHSRSMLKSGAVASYGAPFSELGRQGARLAQKVLNGSPASSIPFEVPLKYEYSVSKTALQALGVELSDVVKSQVTEIME